MALREIQDYIVTASAIYSCIPRKKTHPILLILFISGWGLDQSTTSMIKATLFWLQIFKFNFLMGFFWYNIQVSKLVGVRWKIFFFFRQVSSQNMYCFVLQKFFKILIGNRSKSRAACRSSHCCWLLCAASFTGNQQWARALDYMPGWSTNFYWHNIAVIWVLFTKAFNTLIYFLPLEAWYK